VFGRYHSCRVVEPDGTVRTKMTELPREEWPVVIHNHHRGYISWDDYLAHHARLAANLTNAGARPPREGHALCPGIMTPVPPARRRGACFSARRVLDLERDPPTAEARCVPYRAPAVSADGDPERCRLEAA